MNCARKQKEGNIILRKLQFIVQLICRTSSYELENVNQHSVQLQVSKENILCLFVCSIRPIRFRPLELYQGMVLFIYHEKSLCFALSSVLGLHSRPYNHLQRQS
jgi:hypothetical protein